MCHVSCVECHLSPVTCHMSLMPTATTTDPPPLTKIYFFRGAILPPSEPKLPVIIQFSCHPFSIWNLFVLDNFVLRLLWMVQKWLWHFLWQGKSTFFCATLLWLLIHLCNFYIIWDLEPPVYSEHVIVYFMTGSSTFNCLGLIIKLDQETWLCRTL